MSALADLTEGPFVAIEWDEERQAESRREYKRRRRQALGKQEVAQRLRRKLFRRQAGSCHYCARKMADEALERGRPTPDEAVTLEHLRSHADGGQTSEENCRAVCFKCNGLKGRLDHAVRALERSMVEGFEWEIHYYAARVEQSLADWDARIAFAAASDAPIASVNPASAVEAGGADGSEGR